MGCNLKTIVILIFAISSLGSFAAPNPYTVTLSAISETTGLGIDNLPLAGSDWVVGYSTAYASGCDDFNLSTGIYYTSNPTMRDSAYITTVLKSNIISYIPADSVCQASASSPLDTTHQAIWADLGLVRLPEFGTQVVSCGANTVCDGVLITKTFSDQVIDIINPTTGTDGNNASDFLFFLYNYDGLSVDMTNGHSGVGGLADLVLPTPENRYCYSIRDASTDGINSTFAINPQVAIKVVNWKTINQGPSIPNSNLNSQTTGKTYVIKGLDSSQLQFIFDDNLDIFPNF